MIKKTRLVFMIGSNMKLVGGGERTLLNYLKNVPEYLKDRLNITVIQTGSYDRERISTEEIEAVLNAPYVDIITLQKYDFFRIKLSSAGFPDFFERIIWYIFRYPLNKRYIQKINRVTRNADIIYLLHNHFCSFIPKGPVVVGSLHEWLPTMGNPLVKFLIKKRIIWPRIDCFHYSSPQFKDTLPSGKFDNLYIPSGIKPFYIITNNEGVRSNEIIKLLFVGRLKQCKGIELILDVFSSLENKEKYELHIVGSGELEYLFESSMDRVIYHGRVDDEQLHKIYSMCNIFIFPTTCDNLGLVVLEALYSGNYAIVDETLRGAFDEFEHLGVLRYSGHNEVALKRNIYEFSNEKYPDEIRKEVQNTILQKYTWEHISEMLFDKLIELRGQTINDR